MLQPGCSRVATDDDPRYQHAMEALEVVSVKHSHGRQAMLRAAQDVTWNGTGVGCRV